MEILRICIVKIYLDTSTRSASTTSVCHFQHELKVSAPGKNRIEADFRDFGRYPVYTNGATALGLLGLRVHTMLCFFGLRDGAAYPRILRVQ